MGDDSDGGERTRPVRPNRAVRLAYRSLLRGRPAGALPASVYWPLAAKYRQQYAVRVGDYSPLLRPYKTVEIDPSSVERLTGRPYPPWENRFGLFGTVRDGDWDRKPLTADPERYPGVCLYGGRAVRDTVLYRSLRTRFEQAAPWSETELYSVLRTELDAGRSVWHGCDTEAEIRRRCERLDTLYQTLRRDGFRSQLSLAHRRRSPPDGDAFPRVMRHEVAVDIGRDGAPLLVEGKHRFMLADLLGIESIPVVVYVRHRDWMERRQAATDRPATRPTHPDLRTMPD